MASLREIRRKIKSVKSTQQITKAMKMVSAAKLRRAQDAITMMRPYAGKLREIMENISGTLDSSTGGDFAKVRPLQNVLLVAINSNRGLCGAFNSNIIRTVNRLVREDYATQTAQGTVKVLCIGKKASDFFSKAKGNLFVGAQLGGTVAGNPHLERITLDKNQDETAREAMLVEMKQRVRDVRQGPDGLIYVLTDENNGQLIRIEPAQ